MFLRLSVSVSRSVRLSVFLRPSVCASLVRMCLSLHFSLPHISGNEASKQTLAATKLGRSSLFSPRPLASTEAFSHGRSSGDISHGRGRGRGRSYFPRQWQRLWQSLFPRQRQILFRKAEAEAIFQGKGKGRGHISHGCFLSHSVKYFQQQSATFHDRKLLYPSFSKFFAKVDRCFGCFHASR